MAISLLVLLENFYLFFVTSLLTFEWLFTCIRTYILTARNFDSFCKNNIFSYLYISTICIWIVLLQFFQKLLTFPNCDSTVLSSRMFFLTVFLYYIKKIIQYLEMSKKRMWHTYTFNAILVYYFTSIPGLFHSPENLPAFGFAI